MIPAFLYQYIYLFIVFIFTYVHMNEYVTQNRYGSGNRLVNSSEFASWALILFLVIFLGNRPITSVFGDTAGYGEIYPLLLNHPFEFHVNAENFIFDNLFAASSRAGLPFSAFLSLMALIYFGCTFLACKKLFPKSPSLSYIVYLGAFSTFSYGINGFKAGAAAAIFLVALAYRRNWLITIPLIIVSLGFHHSMIMTIGAYIAVTFVKNPKYYLYFWAFGLTMAFLHVGYFQNLFGSFADDSGKGYLLVDQNDGLTYITGFRFDFVLYSMVPVWLGYKNIKTNYKSQTYSFLLNFYLFTNGIWLLCMYASFTNRIAYLSWFVYPIVLLYPYLDKNNPRFSLRAIPTVVYRHLGFTLFMVVIYYGILR